MEAQVVELGLATKDGKGGWPFSGVQGSGGGQNGNGVRSGGGNGSSSDTQCSDGGKGGSGNVGCEGVGARL